MEKGNHVAIVGCSNPLSDDSARLIEKLKTVLEEMGLVVRISKGIYASDYAAAKVRAAALNDYFADADIKAIFDMSGGDMANEILPYLDYEGIKSNPKLFFGYSDLTTVINAIYQKTRQSCILYQIRNIISENENNLSIEIAKKQRMDFKQSLICNRTRKFETTPLGSFSYKYIQENKMKGIVVGGNIRCLLKLAGTPYFPEVQDNILFLEARSGDIPQMATYLSQLEQMGVFHKVSGILLGTFTAMDAKRGSSEIERLLLCHMDRQIPIVRTMEIGHAPSSKALEIGGYYSF